MKMRRPFSWQHAKTSCSNHQKWKKHFSIKLWTASPFVILSQYYYAELYWSAAEQANYSHVNITEYYFDQLPYISSAFSCWENDWLIIGHHYLLLFYVLLLTLLFVFLRESWCWLHFSQWVWSSFIGWSWIDIWSSQKSSEPSFLLGMAHNQIKCVLTWLVYSSYQVPPVWACFIISQVAVFI